MANVIDYSNLNWLRSGEKSQLFQTLRKLRRPLLKRKKKNRKTGGIWKDRVSALSFRQSDVKTKATYFSYSPVWL